MLPLEREIYEQEFLGPTRIENQPPGLEGHNLISASVAGHARFRKASGVAFSDKVVKWQEPITTQHVDFLIQKLRQTVGENGDKGFNIVSVVRWINFTTFDIISDLGWGESSQCPEKQDYHPWITVVQ